MATHVSPGPGASPWSAWPSSAVRCFPDDVKMWYPSEVATRTLMTQGYAHRPEVSDCGAGIRPELQEQIFDAFFTTKPSGLGIGLSISRTIIEAHEGRLWAEARPEGGLIVRVWVPAERAGSLSGVQCM